MAIDSRSATIAENNEGADPNLDRGWAWLILLSALLTHILTFGLAYASVGAFYVELLEEFGQSEAATSWTGSILLGVMLCSGPISSVLVSRFGAMVTAVTGGAFASAGLALSSLAPRLTYLYVTFGVLTGLGFGLSYLPCIVMLGKFFERRRSMAYGLAVSGSGVGTFIFAPLTQYCIDAVGWRATFLVLGGFCLILCLCGATYRTDKLPKKFQDDDGNLTIHASSSSIFMFFSDVTSSLMADPTDTGATPSILTIPPGERDVETQTVVSCVSGERALRNLLLAGDAGILPLNASNNAVCDGYHCNPDKYNEDGTLRKPPPPPPLPSLPPVTVVDGPLLPLPALTLTTTDKDPTPIVPSIAVDTIQLALIDGTPPPPATSAEPGQSPSPSTVTAEFPPLLTPLSELGLTETVMANTLSPPAISVSRESRRYHHVSPSTSLLDVHKTEPAIIAITDLDQSSAASQEKRSSTAGLVDQSHPPSRCFPLGSHLGPCLVFTQLLRNHFFVLFCISNLLMCVGYQLPYMYFKAFAIDLGISDNDWSYILSVMGITDMVGRIVVGFIFDRITSGYGRLFGFMTASVMSGMFLFSVTYATEFVGLAVLAALYSLLAGSTDSLVPALLAHFIGIDTLAYSFGMIIEMQGTGFLIGPPLAGTLYRYFGEQYSIVFYTGGISFALAGLVLILQPILAGKLPASCSCPRCRT